MRALRAATFAELLKVLRVPSFMVPTIAFPILFFAMFGLPNASRTIAGINLGAYLMASYGAYAIMATALISFGVSIAAERALGWNRLLRVTPLTPGAYFGAKTIMALALSAMSLTALFTFGFAVGHVSLPLLTWLKLGGVLLVGTVPFLLLGTAIGYSVSPAAAAPITTLIFLPLSFASGLFMPLAMLPRAVQQAAPWLPSYHVGQLGWTTIGGGDGRGLGPHLLWIGGYAVIFGLFAFAAHRRDEGRQFG
ncbi:MAG TPA: ABC transporter permease [Gemmatimonadaceae bacterium]|nr:ABC transporter permease [Gemmatimonadaceae bacterium]